MINETIGHFGCNKQTNIPFVTAARSANMLNWSFIFLKCMHLLAYILEHSLAANFLLNILLKILFIKFYYVENVSIYFWNIIITKYIIVWVCFRELVKTFVCLTNALKHLLHKQSCNMLLLFNKNACNILNIYNWCIYNMSLC